MMENLNKAVGFILAALLAFTPAFALAAHGNRSIPQTPGTIRASSHFQFGNDRWRGGTSNGIGNGGRSMGIGNAYGHSKHGTGTTTPDTIAPVLTSVAAVPTASTTATVTWTTNELSTSKVYFSTTTPVNLATAPSVGTTTLSMSHSIGLAGLTASTTYYVVARSADASNNSATSSQVTFTTPSI